MYTCSVDYVDIIRNKQLIDKLRVTLPETLECEGHIFCTCFLHMSDIVLHSSAQYDLICFKILIYFNCKYQIRCRSDLSDVCQS